MLGSTSSSGKYNRLKIGANSSCFVVTVENLSFGLEKDDIATHTATMFNAVCALKGPCTCAMLGNDEICGPLKQRVGG